MLFEHVQLVKPYLMPIHEPGPKAETLQWLGAL